MICSTILQKARLYTCFLPLDLAISPWKAGIAPLLRDESFDPLFFPMRPPFPLLTPFSMCFDVLGCVSAERWAIEFSGERTQAASLAQTFASLTGLEYHGRIGELNAFEFTFPVDAKTGFKELLSGTRAILKAISSSNPFSTGPTHVLPDMSRLYTYAENVYASKKMSKLTHVVRNFAIRYGISWAEEQVSRPVEKRSVAVNIADPLYNAQYHLHRITSGLATLNVTGAWDLGYTGQGVVIAIVDDGLQYVHPDIQANYHAESSFNFNFGRADPSPSSLISDYHGTSSAGVAAARDDGATCGVGVAYRAGLSGVVILQKDDLMDSRDASALQYALSVNHIYSNSWGPTDGGVSFSGPGPLTNQAIDLGIRTGRNGLGAIYVWAGGNGGQVDNCNYDGYASKRQVLTIGAVDASGVKSSFSEECSALLVVAPSASNERSFIRTTDLLGRNGRNGGDCHLTFSGTSAACPAVAGVVALMIEANPGLTWLDVQRILIDTAIRTDPRSSTWVQNGSGRWASHNYGFGLADTYSAVVMAKKLKDSPEMTPMTEEIVLNYLNPDLTTFTPTSPNRFGATFEIPVIENVTLHHVELVVDEIQTADSGRLQVLLTSPSGFVSTFAKPHRPNAANLRKWTFTSRLLWGESSAGTWTLSVTDGAIGTIRSFSLRIWATPDAIVTNSVYKRKAGSEYLSIDAPIPAPVANVPIKPIPAPVNIPSPVAKTPIAKPPTTTAPVTTAPITPPITAPTGGTIGSPTGSTTTQVIIFLIITVVALAIVGGLVYGIYWYWKNRNHNPYGGLEAVLGQDIYGPGESEVYQPLETNTDASEDDDDDGLVESNVPLDTI